MIILKKLTLKCPIVNFDDSGVDTLEGWIELRYDIFLNYCFVPLITIASNLLHCCLFEGI